jgi:hypothetical protein
MLALVMTAGYATAQSTDASSAADRTGAAAASYWGVDTNGKRVDVQAPYGGNSQAKADAIEAPLTERLNRQALQDAVPSR